MNVGLATCHGMRQPRLRHVRHGFPFLFATQALTPKKPDMIKYAILVILLTGCSLDPFDPMIGPRNPEPGAARQLTGRNDISQFDKNCLLEQQKCPVTVLRHLSDSPSREIRALVAANPSADKALLEKLSYDTDTAVRQYVGANPNISRKTLKKLAMDPNELVRSSVVSNPNWTPDEIRQMYRKKTAASSEIARNPSAPPDVLKELTYGSDYNVLGTLARNPSIPPYVIHRLANDPSPSIRLMLADNKALPTSTLKKLANDPDSDVRSFAVDQLARRKQNR